jgi:hypothetical protein
METPLCLQKCTVPVHVAVVPIILKHTVNADYYLYDFKEQCPLFLLSTSKWPLKVPLRISGLELRKH